MQAEWKFFKSMLSEHKNSSQQECEPVTSRFSADEIINSEEQEKNWLAKSKTEKINYKLLT